MNTSTFRSTFICCFKYFHFFFIFADGAKAIRRYYASMPDFKFDEFKPKKFLVGTNTQDLFILLNNSFQFLQGLNLDKQNHIRKERLNPALGTYYSTPLAFHQGYKQWLFDLNGRRYLDMFGGICTVSIGHCHP